MTKTMKTIYLAWDRVEPAPAETIAAGLTPARWVDIPVGAPFVRHEALRDVSRWIHVARVRQWQACSNGKTGRGWIEWGWFKTPEGAAQRLREHHKK